MLKNTNIHLRRPNLSHFDPTRIFRNLMESELKMLMDYESYIYILILKCKYKWISGIYDSLQKMVKVKWDKFWGTDENGKMGQILVDGSSKFFFQYIGVLIYIINFSCDKNFIQFYINT